MFIGTPCILNLDLNLPEFMILKYQGLLLYVDKMYESENFKLWQKLNCFPVHLIQLKGESV